MFDVFFLQLMATVSYQQQKREGGGAANPVLFTDSVIIKIWN